MESKQKFTKSLILITQECSQNFISYECRNAHSNPLFYEHEVVKLHEKIIIENCLFSVNLLILIFHQCLIIVLPFPQTLIGTRHPVLRKDS